MKDRKIKVAEVNIDDADQAIAFLKQKAEESSRACERAAEYYDTMRVYHKHMVDLMSSLQEYKDKKDDEAREDVRAIAEAAQEVIEAMMQLRNSEFNDDSTDLEAWESELLSSDDGKVADEELNKEGAQFLDKYNFHKARLGLKTQKDVADLVGLDRRHISAIESGKQQPQFKTIKKIADGFGLPVNELI